MNENTEHVRLRQLLAALPDIGNYETLLYVGGHYRYGRDLQLLPFFFERNYKVDVVEVFRGNVHDLTKDIRLNNVFEADIRSFAPSWEYDITLWHHGPEHVTGDELPGIMKLMKRYTKKYIIFGTPNGYYEQGAEYGNDNERHLSHWYAKDFLNLGFETSEIGMKDKKQGNIFAWKKLF